jgi:hypothetical protein
VLERFAHQIDDTLCVGQRRPQDTDERVLLFIKMRPGQKFTRAFEEEVRTAIRTGLSRRHEPSYVFEVTEIPVCGLYCGVSSFLRLAKPEALLIVHGEQQGLSGLAPLFYYNAIDAIYCPAED